MKIMMMAALAALQVCAMMARTAPGADAGQGLKDVLGGDVLVGVALNVRQSSGQVPEATAVVRKHFNSIVAENCMKSGLLQPEEGRFYFGAADSLMQFATDNGLTVIGHCLVWHSQAPSWMFTGKDGQPVSRKVLIKRMQNHIRKVVRHYKGRVRGWDVVNEAIEDDGSFRKSPYYNIIGEDFIEIAFRTAHEADPDAELYYNDFSMATPAKRDAVCRMVRRLRAKGVRIDAVGMQSHCGLDYPRLDLYEAAIDSFAACGVKVMATELDVNVLPNPKGFGGAAIDQNFEYRKQLNPYTEALPDSIYRCLEQRYIDLFGIYRRHRHQMSRITLWGVSDLESWLNDFPVHGRTNYPLLFDRHYREKPVVRKIMELWR